MHGKWGKKTSALTDYSPRFHLINLDSHPANSIIVSTCQS